MTILSKDALQKIKRERQERNEDQPVEDVDALFRDLDTKIEEKKEKKGDYDALLEDDFESFEE
ncbi:hypothetical protein [Legionella jordanis]|uniref:Uncharacterized protein n=1 Tax=Legionella jordanis TaxID=456 RepID=A0A0W0VCR8_9GAMM|nr:hypothetical protein [Legionella jordanis]KTD17922.1 hypothetical protein Ljor_2228 [Legionella jordanis]RMX02378.1 hypothetical protein EAW55_09010 [Legionella jordanis]RMX15748.1 hypothetical protein EAS68_11565 [Legionella jordanis]VEH13987.1 Uncharacterised protein [Legionella jordanis]HAT8714354.1 hypothetical protein [Legionella jordanis]